MVDRDFGHWLAGFIDGEGCFYITRDNARAVYRARFSLSIRADDRPIVEECRRRCGIGTIHEYQGQSGQRVVRWMIQSREDCDELVLLLSRYPLRAKKRKDFEVWRDAVRAQHEVRSGRADNTVVREVMRTLKQRLAVTRLEGLE